MKLEERRNSILNFLASQKQPISGSKLSEKFGVSRQIIVLDIATLKSNGYKILSTGKGYILQKSSLTSRVFKVHHTSSQSEDELCSIVDLGATVEDVFVWHKVYGKIVAPLNISSRLQVSQFMEGVRSGKSKELMNITDGYHYHTITAKDEEVLDLVEKILGEKNYIVSELEYKENNIP